VSGVPSPPVFEVAQEVHRDLTRRGIVHAFVGGLAVHAHGWQRFPGEGVEVLVASGTGVPIALRFEARGVAVV